MSQGEGGGRPLLFKTVKDLRDAITAYFSSCLEPYEVYAYNKKGNKYKKKNKAGRMVFVKEIKYRQIKPFTISGLAVALNTSRQTLINYQNKDKYFDTIKKAKDICEAFAEENLYKGGGQVAGIIFSLKNGYEGWKDESTTTLKGGLNLTQILKEAQDKKDEK